MPSVGLEIRSAHTFTIGCAQPLLTSLVQFQGVEDFSQDVEGAYDQGRDERQDYDDDRY